MKLNKNLVSLSILLTILISLVSNTSVETANKNRIQSKSETRLKSESTSHIGLKSQSSSKASIFESINAYFTKSHNSHRKKARTEFKSEPSSQQPSHNAESTQPNEAEKELGPVNPFEFKTDQPGEAHADKRSNNNPNIFGMTGEIEIGKGPVFYEGWVKYFRYVFDDGAKKPQAFFKNPEFLNQQRRPQVVNGVPSEMAFYATLYRNNLVISESRQSAFTTQYDVLKVDYIKPVLEDDRFEGGIQDFGSFKEGECFKVLTSQAGKWIWVICTEENSDKVKLMSILKRIVVKNQRDAGYVNVPKKSKKDTRNAIDRMKIKRGTELDKQTYGVTFEKDKQLTDGYWIVLQEWSTCTVRCGGGTQSLHRMCVPPKNGGAPCEGKAVITKRCGLDPCPSIKSRDEKEKDLQNLVKNPEIKIMPFSNRPQRYDKCHLKESDALLTTGVPKSLQVDNVMKTTVVQVPVRLVMNMRTISAYAGTEYTDLKVSFDIQKTRFMKSGRDATCFVIKEFGHNQLETHANNTDIVDHTAEFCPFGIESTSMLKHEWDYDFHLFKYQCHEVREVEAVLSDEDKDELNRKKNQMNLDIINKQKKEVLQQEEEDTSYMLKKTQKQSLQAIQKEMKLERMIEEEEKEREDEEQKLKMKELEKEKTKADCLNKAIKAKEEENQYNIHKLEDKESITDFKMDVNKQIQISRAKLKSRLQKLKNRAASKSQAIDQQILNIRLEMANALSRRAKSGNALLCHRMADLMANKTEAKKEEQPKDKDEEIKTPDDYCLANFVTDPETLTECKKAVSDKNEHLFLEICCDHEINIEEVENYKKCVNFRDNKKKPADIEARFIWNNELYGRKKYENQY